VPAHCFYCYYIDFCATSHNFPQKLLQVKPVPKSLRQKNAKAQRFVGQTAAGRSKPIINVRSLRDPSGCGDERCVNRGPALQCAAAATAADNAASDDPTLT